MDPIEKDKQFLLVEQGSLGGSAGTFGVHWSKEHRLWRVFIWEPFQQPRGRKDLYQEPLATSIQFGRDRKPTHYKKSILSKGPNTWQWFSLRALDGKVTPRDAVKWPTLYIETVVRQFQWSAYYALHRKALDPLRSSDIVKECILHQVNSTK